MGSHQLCLKWKDHQTNMLTGFEELLTNEALVDVTLACEGESLRVHKVILSAFSPFFQKLLLENPCQHPIVILNGIKYTELRTIVDFMYRGEVNVNQDQLAALLHTAESLKVKGLTVEAGQRGKEISCLRPPSGTEKNMVPVLSTAEKKGFTKSIRKRRNRTRHKIHTASSSGTESEEDQGSSNIEVSSVELAYATPDATTESNTPYPTIVSSHSQVDFISHSLFNTDIEESNEFSSSHNFKSPMNSSIPNNESSNCGGDMKEEESSQHLSDLQNNSPLLSQLLIQTHNLTTAAHSSTSHVEHGKERHVSHNIINAGPHNEQLSPPLENQHTESNDVKRLPHRSPYLSGRKVAFEGSSLQPRCPYCRKIYSRLSNLKRHMEIHMLDRKTYKCYICQKRFSWKTTLSSHLRRDHYVKVRSWAHQE